MTRCAPRPTCSLSTARANDQAVYHQVGIAADRGGEVGVIIESQSIVPDVVGAVDGFGHGAQGHRLNEVFLALAFHVLKQFVVGMHSTLLFEELFSSDKAGLFQNKAGLLPDNPWLFLNTPGVFLISPKVFPDTLGVLRKIAVSYIIITFV